MSLQDIEAHPACLGSCIEYEDYCQLLIIRRKELRLSQLQIDEIAGLPTGYTGKLECKMRKFGSISFGSMLGALGLRLVLVRSMTSHSNSYEITKASINKLKKIRDISSSKGGKNRVAKLSALEIRASARHAAQLRWQNVRLQNKQKMRK